MQTFQFNATKPIEELRKSPYHQQLGRKLCAAFVAQQQGIRLETAFTKIEEPIGDMWLTVAEIVREAYSGRLSPEERSTVSGETKNGVVQ